jgi:hypothetical protein
MRSEGRSLPGVVGFHAGTCPASQRVLQARRAQHAAERIPFIDRDLPPTSEELAPAWRPSIETCIEAFGPERSMFESNFPPDKCGVSARVLWNAFKRLSTGYSEDEKAALFAGTAVRAYRLPETLAQPAEAQGQAS